MDTLFRHSVSCKRAGQFQPAFLFSLLCFAALLSPTGASAATDGLKRQQAEVLFLSFSDPDLPDIAALIEEAQTQILEGRNIPVHFTLEYVDPSLADADPSHARKMLSFLQEKYQGQNFDLVITIGEQTVPILEGIHRKLFPEAALVFFAVDLPDGTTGFKRRPGTTGVIRKLNYLPTLDLALRQNPGTHHVIVICGSSALEKLELKVARAEFGFYEPSVDFQYWTDLNFTDMRSQLANLSSDSIILFLDFSTDADGEHFISTRVLPTLVKSTLRPMYGTLSSFVGTGIVGGSVVDLRDVGRILGQDGARILNGQKPENIPVETNEFQHDVFDWRQLHRWGLKDDQLPPGSSVLYWQYSPWELYRARILGLCSVLVIETLLIVVLLRSRAKRKRAEEILRLKEEELSEAQRIAQLGSWQWNPVTDTLTLSDALFNLTHFDPSASAPSFQQLTSFFTSNSWQKLAQSLEDVRRTGKACELELEGIRPDASRIWVNVRATAVRNGANRIVRLRGTMQDITERKRAEEVRLKHSAIVESSDDAIISVGLDGVIVTWNSGAQRIFDYDEEEVTGQSITILTSPEMEQDQQMILQRVKAGETIEHFETIRMAKGGRRINVSLTLSPVKDTTGRIVGISEIARDITQSKQAQQALVESEKRFRLMADSAPVLMWLSGPGRSYTDFNREWLRFTGRTMEEELADGWQSNVHSEDSQKRLQDYDRAFDLRQSFETEYRMKRYDGQYRWMLDHGVPRFTEDGSFAGYVGCCIDITDQKDAKAALRELNHRLIHAQEEERARIAGELHDDINQRLALLANGFHELEQSAGGRDRSLWTKTLRDLEQLTSEIASDLQHLSHRLHPSKLYYLGLGAAVRDLCHEFSKQHRIEVKCVVHDVPRHLDENVSLSLFRTAQESLHNAAKHSHAQHIKVELTGEPALVRLRVSDDGIGFDLSQIPECRGLGLISMRERMKLAGGELSIWSRPSLGTQVEGMVPVISGRAQSA